MESDTDGNYVLHCSYIALSNPALPVKSHRSRGTHILIGKDITVLGERTFNQCNNVKTVTFEEGSKLNALSVGALCGSYVLKEIQLPDSMRYLEYSALGSNTALVNVYIPKYVKWIHESTFSSSTKVFLNVVEGSYAASYAKNNNLSYIFVEDPEASKTGFFEENGELYYYENGIKHTERGVFQVGDDFYYAKSGGALVRNTRIWASITNDLVPYDIRWCSALYIALHCTNNNFLATQQICEGSSQR